MIAFFLAWLLISSVFLNVWLCIACCRNDSCRNDRPRF